MIVTESFLPSVNGVTGSVLRVPEHLRRQHHPTLVVAPEGGPSGHDGVPVVRVPAVSLPGLSTLPVGLPTRRLQDVMAGFGPGRRSPGLAVRAGCRGMTGAAARLPTVAVYQTDLPEYARAYPGLTAQHRVALAPPHPQAGRPHPGTLRGGRDALDAYGMKRV